MKEKLTKNSGLKLISVFCAFFVWLAVVNVANPVKVGTQEVTVDIINESVLAEKNLTYEIAGKKTATITYRVRTKNAYKVKPSDFRVYADISEMYDVTGAIPVKVEVLNNDILFESTPVAKAPGVIKIETEALQTKRFDLVVKPTGTPAEGFEMGETVLSPDFVYVKGPVSQIGRIREVGVEFEVGGASNDISGVETPIFYDSNGNKLELNEKVTILSGDISYSMVMLKVKNLTLDFAVTGEVAEGYRFTGVETAVTSVPVAGLKSVLASMSTLLIQDASLNVDGVTADKQCHINLDDFLPDNVTIVGMKDHVIPVMLKVEALEERIFKVDVTDILMENVREEYIYEFDAAQVDVVVRGLKDDLDSLTAENLNAKIDVVNLSPGVHTGILTFQLDDAFEVMQYGAFELEVIGEEETSDAETVSAEPGDDDESHAATQSSSSEADTGAE